MHDVIFERLKVATVKIQISLKVATDITVVMSQ